MEQLKCTTCGGNLTLSADGLHAQCEVCGNIYEYKAPKEDYWVAQLNEANDLRFNMDFDGAIAKYRVITNNNKNDSEAWWGLLLSKYGVAYEIDPITEQYIPTFHRNRRSNIAEDVAGKNAIVCASDHQKDAYNSNIAELRRIQEGIEKVANQCDPYDVFISFKATDVNGNNTTDRDIAYNIYDELKNNNIKTFFSEVSLMDMAASDYEAVIFNALNTCKVFILVGTSKENINATWVKNEWTRYRERVAEDVKNGGMVSSHFAVVGGDMEPSDLPLLFSKTQNVMLKKYAGDSYKKDIATSIGKLLGIDGDVSASTNEKKLIAKKYAMAEELLDNGEIEKARKYYVEATELDPKNMESWWRLFCIDNNINVREGLRFVNTCKGSISDYDKAQSVNERTIGLLLDKRLSKIRTQGDKNLLAKIDKFDKLSQQNYKSANDRLNEEIYNIGVMNMNNRKYDDAVSAMKGYIEHVDEKAVNYNAYLILAYASYRINIKDEIEIRCKIGTPELNKKALEEYKFVRPLFTGEYYNKAIELATGSDKSALIARRDTILRDYDDNFKQIEQDLANHATELMENGHFDSANKEFKYLLNNVDPNNDDYARNIYLTAMGETSMEWLKSRVENGDPYLPYVDNKDFNNLLARGGKLAEEAIALREYLEKTFKEVTAKNNASIFEKAESAFKSKDYAESYRLYTKLKPLFDGKAVYYERLLLSAYKVSSRADLFEFVSHSISLAEMLEKSPMLKELYENSDIDNASIKEYQEGIDKAVDKAKGAYNNAVQAQDKANSAVYKEARSKAGKVLKVLSIVFFALGIVMMLFVASGLGNAIGLLTNDMSITLGVLFLVLAVVTLIVNLTAVRPRLKKLIARHIDAKNSVNIMKITYTASKSESDVVNFYFTSKESAKKNFKKEVTDTYLQYRPKKTKSTTSTSSSSYSSTSTSKKDRSDSIVGLLILSVIFPPFLIFAIIKLIKGKKN